MACSYTSIPSTFAAAGYTSPMNVESMLRNKVDLYSAMPVERSLLNATPFDNTFASVAPFVGGASSFETERALRFGGAAGSFSPVVEFGAHTGRVFGADCGAKLAQIIAARLNTFVGQEVAVRIGAEWGAEICAKLGAELAIRLVNGWSVEECARWCYTFGAERGAELGSIIAQRMGAIYTAEFAARIGAELFADVCAKQCYVIAARLHETRFGGAFGGRVNNWMTGSSYPTSTFGSYGSYGYPTSSFERFGGLFGGRPELFNNTWTGAFPTYPTYGSFPSTFGANTWFNAPTDKLYNIAFRPSSELEMYTLTNPIRMIDVEGNRQLYLCFELKGFKPEEVIVTLNKAERAVVVEAAHEVKEGKEHSIARKYSRKFVLPETLSKVDLTKVELKSCMTQEGYLVVECQLPKMTTEEIAKSPVMSEMYNRMPFAGHNAVHNFGGMHSISHNYNHVKPVTVKTA